MKMLEIPKKKTKIVQFRLTKSQHERLKNLAESEGYKIISQYIIESEGVVQVPTKDCTHEN